MLCASKLNIKIRRVSHILYFTQPFKLISDKLKTQDYESSFKTLTYGEHQIMDDQKRIELEAAAFRRLVSHLQKRTDVQNIELMNLSGFCRNCLSKWYQEAADDMGEAMDKEQARQIIYGMPSDEWKAKYQTDANKDQLNSFEENRPDKN